MTTERVERRLAAILSADVVGYSGMMATDEAGTLARLQAHRRELIDPQIAEYNGRLVKLMGDGALVEFSSVVDAVECAVSIQRGMSQRNEHEPEAQRIVFRVGINIGEIIVDGDDIYGDGVNVAARMEQLAASGGVCISGDAYRQARGRAEVSFEDLGDQEVKNIPEPVRAYRVLLEPDAAGEIAPRPEPRASFARRWRVAITGAAAAVLIGVAAGVLLSLEPWVPRVEPAVEANMAFSLPEKPSVAILPFKNLSGDPDQEFLADGISESIILALSRTPNLFVIASNSAFSYKGKAVKVHQVAEELGVRYVLEGSFQRSGESVRITARLIDALGGRQMWAERYDRGLTDIFALQDEIARTVLTEIQVKLTEGEGTRKLLAGTVDPEAYEAYLRGKVSLFKFNKEENLKARELCGRAAELDPNYAAAYACLATTYRTAHRFLWTEDRAAALDKARALIDKALVLDENSPHAIYEKGFLHMANESDVESAMPLLEKAVRLDPNWARAKGGLAIALIMAGKPIEGIEQIEAAMRLHPFYPSYYLAYLTEGHMWAGNHEEAVRVGRQYFDYDPDAEKSSFSAWVHAFIAFSYMALGQDDDAATHIRKALEIEPDFTAAYLRDNRANKSREDVERLVGVLIVAGLPETPPLPLPDKPSIAVLPFNNLSDDPEQEWFADGMTDDLITDLSKISGLFVIARNSSFTYKGKAVDVKQVGRELGVKYVLEGSVRRAGDSLRINAQLVDASTGGHLWAERYSSAYEEIFRLQDEVIGKIVASLSVTLTGEEQTQLDRAPTDNLEAYEHYQRGEQSLSNSAWALEGVAEALAEFESAYVLDPTFAEAYAGDASAAHQAYAGTMFWILKGQEARARAESSALHALVLDPKNARAHGVLSALAMLDGNHDVSVEKAQEAVAGDPNNVEAQIQLALTHAFMGEHAKAVEAVQEGLRLDPKPSPLLQLNAGMTFFFAKRYASAIELLEAASQATPDSNPVLLFLAASYAQSGRIDDAIAVFATANKIWPAASRQSWRQVGFSFLRREDDLELLISALALAGMPEWPYGFEGDPANRLSEAELQEQMENGVTIEGVWDFGGWAETGEGGIPATMRFAPGGRWHWNSDEFGEDTGFSMVRNGMKCDRTPDGRLGLWHCGYIYRNPEGTREQNNEYIEVMTDFILYYSVVSAPD